MSKECRIVNSGGGAVAGGYVNSCEQLIDDKNEIVMAASKITMDADQPVAPKTHEVCSLSSNEINKLKESKRLNTIKIMQELYNNDVKDKETIAELKKQVEFVSDK